MKVFFVIILFIAALAVQAQPPAPAAPAKGWHLKDQHADHIPGISLDKAYALMKDKAPKRVIVAVIDSGIDTLHEDLRSMLWRNKKEIAGNGLDDDGNGYTDDVHGWNFLGGKDGKNVNRDSYESARVYFKYKEKFSNINVSEVADADKMLYADWKRAAKERPGASKSGLDAKGMVKFRHAMIRNDSILRAALQREKYTGNELAAFTPDDDITQQSKTDLLFFLKANKAMDSDVAAFMKIFIDWADAQVKVMEAAEQAPANFRDDVVMDDYDDLSDRFYGNSDVMAGRAFHGTHVSGIIAADRNNDKGIQGIAPHVEIMTLRAVPDGDEHDKDIALAIRYAADNGARIINMSFGKSFSPEKHWVDDAVRYAAEKNVLIVHAAGNEGKDIDSAFNFPNPVFADDGARAANWITVGASGDSAHGGLVASFSNFGKQEVDVFAPGVQIYSTVPGGDQYNYASGTSMAAPVVSGIAALILSYYPKLTAIELKEIIEASVVKLPELEKLCKTGGLVNAYEALKMAGRRK